MSGLELCRCGHERDEHRAGVGCSHVNASKRFPKTARCHCARFQFDPELADSEAFLGKLLNHVARKQNLGLEQVERDELLQVMRISLWHAATKFDSRSHIRFGSFAAFELYQDAIDEVRSNRMFGRLGQYRLQPLPPASDADDAWHIDPRDPLDDDASGASRLERVIAELTVDPPDAGDVDLRWAFTDRDREALRAAGGDGGGEAESAPRGAREPAWSGSLVSLIDVHARTLEDVEGAAA